MAVAFADYERVRAELPGLLSAAVKDAMVSAMKQGMPADEAADLTACAAADLIRAVYGDSQLLPLAEKIIGRVGRSLAEAQR